MLIPVILSGGSGTRLWPLSRELFPKQFMPLLSDAQSLFQATILRAKRIPDIGTPLVITNEHHRFLVAAQLQELGVHAEVVLEPQGRNTAPAVAVAALAALERDPEAELLVLPADHYIRDEVAFATTVTACRTLATVGRLVTFGIVPDAPETGYGYIHKQSAQLVDCANAFAVDRFVEKPDLATARRYLADGDYLWNSGMFLFRASTILDELAAFAPDILGNCRQALIDARRDLDFLRLDATAFADCPSDSLDYAIMEKTNRSAVVVLDCGWNDVGAWSALHTVHDKDERGNVLIGDILAEDCSDCYLHGTTRLIAAIGLSNIVLVETKDVIFLAPLGRVQDVKQLVNRLKQNDRSEVETHCKIYRPWGNYEGIDVGDRYQVKRIIVYPGHTLSLQKHHHRAEHWVVVRGTAIVTRDAEEMLLTENQSIYIPLGTIHRLHNPGKVNLELIEIQSGSYLGEDDIVRFEDIYGRNQ